MPLFSSDDPEQLLKDATQAMKAGEAQESVWSKIQKTYQQRLAAEASGVYRMNPDFKSWMSAPDAEQVFDEGIDLDVGEQEENKRYKSWSEQAGLQKPIAQFGSDLAEGVVGGAAKTVVGGGDMIRRALGMERVVDKPEVMQLTGIPETWGGQMGRGAESLAEFAVPGMKTTKAMSGASMLPRMLAQGGTAGLVSALQSGGDPYQILLTGGISSLAPLLGIFMKGGKHGMDVVESKLGTEAVENIIAGAATGNRGRIAMGFKNAMDALRTWTGKDPVAAKTAMKEAIEKTAGRPVPPGTQGGQFAAPLTPPTSTAAQTAAPTLGPAAQKIQKQLTGFRGPSNVNPPFGTAAPGPATSPTSPLVTNPFTQTSTSSTLLPGSTTVPKPPPTPAVKPAPAPKRWVVPMPQPRVQAAPAAPKPAKVPIPAVKWPEKVPAPKATETAAKAPTVKPPPIRKTDPEVIRDVLSRAKPPEPKIPVRNPKTGRWEKAPPKTSQAPKEIPEGKQFGRFF